MMWAGVGSIFMFVAVCAGAFGGHALKARLPADLLAIFEVGVRYHVYHALALFAVAWLSQTNPHRFVGYAGWCFTIGVVLFSGSLYALALSGTRAWGMVTPFGGLAFLAGWGFLALRCVRAG